MQNQLYLINSDQEQFKKENSSDVAVEKVPGRETVALTFMSARICNFDCTYCFA